MLIPAPMSGTMPQSIVIDGKALAERVRLKLKDEVEIVTRQLGRAPKLAVILVGDNPASKVYVRSKTKAAHECGIATEDVPLSASASQAELLGAINKLNASPDLDGILLQLPLPKGLDESAAIDAISPGLDVDGLTPISQGLLSRGSRGFRPCTPLGCLALIDEACEKLGRSRELSGLHAVVLGRSVLVGKPVSALLLERNCTVTTCHSRTGNLAEECRRADILVVAIGKSELVKGDWIKPGAIVIDVGINRLPDGRLVGDVDYAAARQLAAAITPVPGGVGPMTIAMLLSNTVSSAKNKVS